MRRILLAAFAVLLLHAAPAMATECTNHALSAYGGTAAASSSAIDYPVSAVNNGRRDGGGAGYWQDGSVNVVGDWATVWWARPRTLSRIVLRGPVFPADTQPWYRTLGSVHVQYWDATTADWVDVVVGTGQRNPVTGWEMPEGSADGSEIKQFDFAPVTTSRIRVFFEDGSIQGWSFLDEIEAYGSGDDCVAEVQCSTSSRALDATMSASSTHSSGLYPLSGVTNGLRESGATKGYWNDDTNALWPDWVQAAWASPVQVDRIVARIPLAQRDFPLGEITLRRTRIQTWDAATSTWVDVAGSTGQDNPILDWTGPIERADGSETKTFDLASPVTTTKVRVLIEDGASDGWSWLDELEVYTADGSGCAETPRDVNLALNDYTGSAFASSEHSSSPAYNLNNDVRQEWPNGWWNSTGYESPEWAGISWARPMTINRIVVRAPYLWSYFTLPERTMGSTRIQYWDGATSAWVDIAGRTGQDNPVLDWVMPVDARDGSEIKQWDFSPIVTTRIRALIEEGTSFGWAHLEEIEAFHV